MKRNYVKPSVRKLEAYQPEPQEAKAILNANENPYNLPQPIIDEIVEEIKNLDFNRYPDPASTELIETYGNYIGFPSEMILAGNGEDEILSYITNTFVGEGDSVVSHSPGFAMYQIWTEIANGKFIEVEDLEDNRINIRGLVEAARRTNAKIIYICSPNNPTGYKITKRDLEELLEASRALVVLDEAYIDFDEESYIDLAHTYGNLIVLRTVSKSFRAPAIRLGFAIAQPALIDAMKKVKAPYNLNAMTQIAGKVIIEHADEILSAVDEIKESRADMYQYLRQFPELTVYPSEANFLYVTTPDHKELQETFEKNGVLVRYFPKDEAFRITIGSPAENELVKESIKETFEENE